MEREDEREGKAKHSNKTWQGDNGIRYNERTINKRPKPELIEFVKNVEHGKACELGPGSGTSTIFLLENNWQVTSYDINMNSKECIESRISESEKEKFKFVRSKFENIELEKDNDLIVAFNSLPFCKKEYFESFFEKVANSIKPGGYLIGNLFGNRHAYNTPDSKMTFHTREEIENLLKKYFIVDFNNAKQFVEREEFKRTLESDRVLWHTYVFRIMKK